MVLGALMKRKARTEGLAEGRAEGRAEANKAWLEWLKRKEEAEAKGEPFNEPSPADRP